MAKLLLIAPYQSDSNIQNWGNSPLGIHRLSAYIRNHSEHTVDIHDIVLDGKINPNRFLNYDFIGFSITDYSMPEDLKLMDTAYKTNPQAVQIVGGVAATLDYSTLLNKSKAEWVVLGYGEKQILSILNGDQSVNGTIRRQFALPTTNQELTSWFMDMDFREMRYEEYWRKTEELYAEPNLDAIRTIRLVTESHCTRKCSFCSVRSWAETATGDFCPVCHIKSPDLIELTKKIAREVPTCRTLYYCCDDFLIHKRTAMEYMEYTKTQNFRILIQTHLTKVQDEKTVKMLADGKVVHATFGLESPLPKILKHYNKTDNIPMLEKIPDIISWCKKYDITPYLLIILFAQQLTLSDLIETIGILRYYIKLGATISINSNLMPYPGSMLYDTKYDAEKDIVVLPNSQYKKETIVLCDDPVVRQIQKEFNKRLPEYLNERTKHQSKDRTGTLILDLLEEIINVEL